MFSVVLVVAYRYQTIKARSVGVGVGVWGWGVGGSEQSTLLSGVSIEHAMFNALGTASSRLSSSAGHETLPC